MFNFGQRKGPERCVGRVLPVRKMAVKFIIEFNEQHRAFSLDEFTKSFLEAIQRVVRQEVQQLLTARPRVNEPRTDEPQINRPIAVSKAKAAQTLGVSVRTLDYCIAHQRIPVLRIGRRVLVPLNSLEAALKRGVLETQPDK